VTAFAETDIDLNWYSSLAQEGSCSHTNATVDLVVPDRLDNQAICVERQAVFGTVLSADIPEGRRNRLRRRVAKAEQIEILCWPERIGKPRSEQHRSLENEAVTMR
jgi:hypothetical protein